MPRPDGAAFREQLDFGDGGLRDALSMFDQMVTFSGHDLRYKDVVQNLHILDYEYYFRLVDALLTENLSATLLLLFLGLFSPLPRGHAVQTPPRARLCSTTVVRNPEARA